MSSELAEEIEILESIYPDELSKISDSELSFRVEPDEPPEDPEDENLILTLALRYPPEYPNALPEFGFEPVEGELAQAEEDALLTGMRDLGEQNLGTAMTFTLVSYLRDELLALTRSRATARAAAQREAERAALAAEEARTRGTPVTASSFAAWRAQFEKEMAVKRVKEEEDRLRGLSAKERDELRRQEARPSGKQLFERDRNLAASDAALADEDATAVDASQYERTRGDESDRDDDDTERLAFSDSD